MISPFVDLTAEQLRLFDEFDQRIILVLAHWDYIMDLEMADLAATLSRC